jgi:hypothetical protein
MKFISIYLKVLPRLIFFLLRPHKYTQPRQFRKPSTLPIDFFKPPVQYLKTQPGTILLDGFNILILLETALSGGYVFEALDGCYRDISSVHGTYRQVQTTEEALIITGKALQQLQLQKVVWVFDAPVSNSGKLKATCYEIANTHHFPWEIRLENDPDKYLIENKTLICSSDAWVLDECKAWFNLGAWIINNTPQLKHSLIFHSKSCIKV